MEATQTTPAADQGRRVKARQKIQRAANLASEQLFINPNTTPHGPALEAALSITEDDLGVVSLEMATAAANFVDMVKAGQRGRTVDYAAYKAVFQSIVDAHNVEVQAEQEAACLKPTWRPKLPGNKGG